MILRILGVTIAGMLILYVAYWIWSGGLSRGFKLASFLDNPFTLWSSSTTGGALRLPGQPDELVDTIDLSTYGIGGTLDSTGDGVSAQDKLDALQNQYESISSQARDPRNFGNPSPYKDQIRLGNHTAQNSSPTTEYITLEVGFNTTAPISLAGWSLQSAVTGVRLVLPQAAPQFVSGVLNNVSYPTLSSGSAVYVISGPSPVGVSFRENICSGYLGELQTFVPELNRSCPLASDELTLNAQNISNFGDSCVDYVQTIPQCHFPGLDSPGNVSTSCAQFVLNRLSYNGCVYAHKNERDFNTGAWRLYLGSGVNLWRDTHDVVRLLDDQGRTVDVISY
jgi:hypothetical protein